jgi:hypothetical protein
MASCSSMQAMTLTDPPQRLQTSTAWDLHNAWPEAEFNLIPNAGHSAFDTANTQALVAATDKFAA